jgi:hypothetical protein
LHVVPASGCPDILVLEIVGVVEQVRAYYLARVAVQIVAKPAEDVGSFQVGSVGVPDG